MIIRQFEVIPYSIPFIKPWQTAGGTYTYREGLWLKLQWDEITGCGEAAPLLGFSRESLKEVHYALEGFHQAIEGESYERDDLQQLIDIHTQNIPSAKFALETAAFDLLARKADKNIAQYLNSDCISQIAVNGIAGLHFSDDGFKVIKVKVGFRNLFDEIENMEDLSKSYGDDVQFRLDLNATLDLPKAIRFCKEMEVFNIDYIEQPLPADELLDLSELRYHTKIPIALDESLTDFGSAEKIIEEQSADVFIIKPMVSGGFSESKKIIQLARDENIRIVVTSSLETNIGRMACFHLAASNEITEACGLATGELLKEDTITPHINDGMLQLPSSPGLGLELHA